MFEDYKSKTEVISAVLDKKLNIFDLKCIRQKHPEYVDSEIMTTAYNLAIEEITERGLKCAEDGSFANMFVDLEHANELADEAKKAGYEIDTIPLENILNEAYLLAKNDDTSAFKLVNFLSDLEQNYGFSPEKIEKLKLKADEYPLSFAKKTKRIARRFKRTERKPGYRKHIIPYLKKLDEFVKEGYELEEEIARIKEIAFNKGVKFYQDLAESIKTINPERSQYLRNVAEKNANVLGMQLIEITE